MRPEGQAKMGYYPTPDKQTELITTWLKPAESGLAEQSMKVLDPCCGKGEALAYIAAHLKAESYGIELSDTRAAEAKTRLDHVINCGYEYAILTDGTFSFCLLNPPYDNEGATGGGARMEETFLMQTTPRLMPQGVLVYIIPHARISDKVARHLMGWYSDVRCFKFAGDDYDVFKQVVIFGIRRETYHTPTGDELRQAQAWAEGKQITGYEEVVETESDEARKVRVIGEVEVAVGKIPSGMTVWLQDEQIACKAKTVTDTMRTWAEQARAWLAEHPAVLKPKSKKVQWPIYAPLPELPEGHGEYTVPFAPIRGEGGKAFRFKYTPVTDDDYLRAANEAASRLESSRAWLDLIPPTAPKPITPAMTPKQGHIAMQVSGGLLWTCSVTHEGKPMLLKGNVSKETIVKDQDGVEELLDDGDDDEKMRKVVVEERFKTTLTTLQANGDLKVHQTPDDIANVLRQHITELAERLQAQNIPLYDFKPEPWEWAVFDPLSKGRKLPGRDETGLTDFQRHVSIALGRVLLQGAGNGFNQAEMGSGKAQPLNAKLLTPDGWRTMGDIQVGDHVIGADGQPTRVIGVFPQGDKDIYRVTFTDGSWAECCLDHLWTVQTPLNKWKGKPPQTLSLKQIIARGLAHRNGNLQYFIPLVKPIQFPERELPIEPYLMGVLLGNGNFCSGGVSVSVPDNETCMTIIELLPDGVDLKHRGQYDWSISTGKRGKWNPVLSALREMGLMGHKAEAKFVPDRYLFASIEQRVSLLQGLLDTDGYVKPGSCTIEYSTASPQLADDVTFLVHSLGGTVTRRFKSSPTYRHNGELQVGQPAYRLFIALPNGIPPFRLSRKQAQYRPRTKYHPSRAIQSIELVGRLPAQCIKVEAKDGLYVTDNCVVTHNTTMALGTIEYLRAAAARRGKTDGYPALVVGPGIVTGDSNWPKEVREVIPGAVGKVIDVTAKPVAKPVTILDYLLNHPEALEADKSRLAVQDSIRRAMREEGYAGDPNPYIWREHVLRIREEVAAWEKRKSQDKKRREKSKEEQVLRHRVGGLMWLGLSVPRDPESEREIASKYSLAQFIREYREGVLPEKSVAIMSFETAKLRSGRVPAMRTKTIKIKVITEVEDEYGDLVEQEVERLVDVCVCPVCGGIVAEKYDPVGQPDLERIIKPSKAGEWVALKRRYCQHPRPRWVWNEEKGKHVWADEDEDGKPYVCGAPLFEQTSLHREAGAVYLSKKARNFFRIAFVDECHEAKAKGTGVGWALSVIGGNTPHTLGLTGTLFGGYSTSIFWLLYRLSAEVRQEFGFNDDMRWANTFGLIKRTFYVDADAEVAEDGAFTGIRHHETISEKPGISPAIARVILPCCTFSGLKDIGLPLPSYSEHMVGIELTDAMRAQMNIVDGSRESPPTGLFKWALDELKRMDGTGRGAISVWLNAALNRPDAMFRAEDIFFNRRLPGQRGRGRFARRRRELVKSVNAVVSEGELLPKEKWLVNLCQAQKAAGRKVLVYVRQTGERDIQERLVQLLGEAGLRADVLRDSVDPRKRVDWITKRVDRLDVLITNARLVRVGLNLVMFPTTVFFEMDWSLYTVWQAMRRVYRPGAPKPVELFFPYYEGTMEENLLSLIGQKMRAAQTLYGDDVAGALVEGDESDIISDLVRSALKGTAIGRPEGVFGMENTITASPLGSPTAISPRVVPKISLTDLWEAARRGEVKVERKRRTVRQVTNQLEKEIKQGTLF